MVRARRGMLSVEFGARAELERRFLHSALIPPRPHEPLCQAIEVGSHTISASIHANDLIFFSDLALPAPRRPVDRESRRRPLSYPDDPESRHQPDTDARTHPAMPTKPALTDGRGPPDLRNAPK